MLASVPGGGRRASAARTHPRPYAQPGRAPGSLRVLRRHRRQRAVMTEQELPAEPGWSLDGRVAIVTGAAGGIGAEIAKALAAQGAAVVVNDVGTTLAGSGRSAQAAQNVVSQIEAAGGTAVANVGDVGDFDEASGIIDAALSSYGRLDVLVNTAGIIRDRMIFNMPEEDWDAVIRVHLKGTFNTTHFASRYWRANRGGEYRLLNFISGAGLFGA